MFLFIFIHSFDSDTHLQGYQACSVDAMMCQKLLKKLGTCEIIVCDVT